MAKFNSVNEVIKKKGNQGKRLLDTGKLSSNLHDLKIYSKGWKGLSQTLLVF